MSNGVLENKKIDYPVFIWASALILLLVLVSVAFPSRAEKIFDTLLDGIIANASWYYVLAVAVILVSVAFFAVSRYGDIRLGPDHSTPDYRYPTWFAMLFSAGMGIGLMFFGVAEPVMHFVNPPKGESATLDAAREAMKLTFFHWGLHAWAIYAIVGLILAYFCYRRGLPLTLRSALYPLIGDKINGPAGYAIDIFAVIGTVLGVAISLGYGGVQINAGLHHLFGLPESKAVQIIIIALVTGLALISVLSGLDRGIRRLSEVNIVLALTLVFFVLLAGPSLFLVQGFVQNTGSYLSEIISKTFNLYVYDPTDWLGGWTILYWGWWISWSPFVGIFIARISRGRTIREFCLGVMLVPAGFTLFWMTVFGNTAIDLILNQGQDVLAEAVQSNNAIALFKFLEYFPLSSVFSFVAIVMVVIFFVTSADSGALVVNMLSSGGQDEAPYWQRIYWASLIGVVAIVLLLAGGLAALQAVTIAGALPFSIMLLWAIWGLMRALNLEFLKKSSLLDSMNTTPALVDQGGDEAWKTRIQNLMDYPAESDVVKFLRTTVKESLRAVCEELKRKNCDAEVVEKKDRVYLEILHGQERDFFYCVRIRHDETPGFAARSDDLTAHREETYYRAEVFLLEGSQHYDVMGYTREQIIHDVLDHYEKHLHFLSLAR